MKGNAWKFCSVPSDARISTLKNVNAWKRSENSSPNQSNRAMVEDGWTIGQPSIGDKQKQKVKMARNEGFCSR